MKTLTIQASIPYAIHIGPQVLETDLLYACCTQLGRRTVIISDSHLLHSQAKNLQQSLQRQGLHVELLHFPASEANKTRETKQQLEDELLLKQCGRDTCLLALGGGVVLDLVGFLGATYCRGVPVIYIPTTLLAMVDASIGGKTGVNTPQGKNLIGTFTPPYAVFMDTAMLTTLPDKEWRNGVAELIKHSLIADPEMFGQLQRQSYKIKQRDAVFLMEMIHASCLIKKNIVEQDEKEQGIRQLLNFGHTIGHAIEAVEHFKVSHGEAVAIGMLVESYLSVQCGWLPNETLVTIQGLLIDYGLPLQTSAFQDKKAFQQRLLLDKKTVQQRARFVLLDGIGKPHCHEQGYTMAVDLQMLDHALDWAAAHFMPSRGDK